MSGQAAKDLTSHPLGVANLGFTVEDFDAVTPPPPLPTLPLIVEYTASPTVGEVAAAPTAPSVIGDLPVIHSSTKGGTEDEIDRRKSIISNASSSQRRSLATRVGSKKASFDLSASRTTMDSLSVTGVDPRRISNGSVLSEAMSDKLLQLRRRFESRANSLRQSTVVQPLTESETDEPSTETDSKSADPAQKQPIDSTAVDANELDTGAVEDPADEAASTRCSRLVRLFTGTIDPQSTAYLLWLSLLTMAVGYNYFTIPLRSTFTIYDEPNSAGRIVWLSLDYVSDLFYAIDIGVQMRVRFVNNGIIETNVVACRRRYFSRLNFKLDLLALLPLDLLYFAIGVSPIVRFPRLLKLKAFWNLFDLLDKVAKNGHAVRIARTLIYMLYIIHLEACFYYIVSRWEGFGINDWVYDVRWNVTAYIYCFYFATKTAGSVGNNPRPNNVVEQAFMVGYWLAGVFVFALLIGQISEIVQAASANKTNYRAQMDTTILYMKSLNVPDYMIEKVRTWFDYNWEQQKTLNETSLLEGLPKKLKTDLAINVHFAILSKVSLFQDCERALLSDLILKLKPVLYLPGDYICKKGEVGMEMYIIMNGQVEVVGGPNNSIVLVTLKEGSVFGEISLMSLSGGNRRTADVRSKGFATLFTLSKADFEEAMQDYPQAYAQLRKRAKRTLTKGKAAKTEKRSVPVEEVIKEREPTPKLLKTVIQAVSKERPTSALTKFIQTTSKSRRGSEMMTANSSSVTTTAVAASVKTTNKRKKMPPMSKTQAKVETHNDDDSLTSEESIHLPADTESTREAPTPPPTSDDTPGALLERLQRMKDSKGLRMPGPSDCTSVFDETKKYLPWLRKKRESKPAALPHVD